jgi:hypothetical protein
MQKGLDKWVSMDFCNSHKTHYFQSYRLVFVADNGQPGEIDTRLYLHGALFNAPKDSTIDSRVVLVSFFSDLNMFKSILNCNNLIPDR